MRPFSLGEDLDLLRESVHAFAEKEQQLSDVRARIGILFQEGGLFDSLTIAENVAYPLLNQAATHKNGQAPPPEEVGRRVRESLSFVEPNLGEIHFLAWPRS